MGWTMEDSAAYRYTLGGGEHGTQPQQNAWRCSWCGRIEGDDDGQGYTDGICSDCLWKYYPERAARVIAAVERAGAELHVLCDAEVDLPCPVANERDDTSPQPPLAEPERHPAHPRGA